MVTQDYTSWKIVNIKNSFPELLKILASESRCFIWAGNQNLSK